MIERLQVFTNKYKNVWSKLAITFLFALFLVGCQSQEKKEEDSITLIAFGDNLLHTAVVEAGKQEDGSYDFSYMYQPISKQLRSADIKLINQETILIEDEKEYSDYPRFGTPIDAGRALAEVGFNGITMATNHAFDKGEIGIRDTIRTMEQYEGVSVTGIYDSESASHDITVLEVEGIKVALLNYTCTLNGIELPEDESYMVNTTWDLDRVAKDMEEAKKVSDILIVLPHWGREYVYEPDEEQQKLAQFFADHGADCIIGTHPHVLEPFVSIRAEDGREVPCYYSLGNCISSQTKVERMLGGMAKIKIVRDKEGVHISNTTLEPIVTHIGKNCEEYKVYMLEDYTDDLASEHFLSRMDKTMSLDGLWTLYYDIIGDRK